ncbi:acyl-CoA dehydrogenase family protein [Pseudarthrobacter sulfonivorans]|uniref:acyl-CoA dehydrogenase family protein n=1 Tax=Pseudarthrobacter sulfonivorans TaxID=121292 RepID=UPI002101F104|nr:acyl-CoA dehydrogenase family protein [Pseudarthrobacter sulfonivorans]
MTHYADREINVDFIDALTTFIERVVRPVETRYAAELSTTGTIDPTAQLSERRALRRQSAELGYYSAHMPAELGGFGLNAATIAAAYRAIGRSGLLLADRGGVLPNVEGPYLSMAAFNDAQREQYLSPLMRAEIEGCFALTEPDSGSDAGNMRTKATLEQDTWTISGTKRFITHGAHADFVQVIAVTDPDAAPSQRHSAFIVDSGTPGLSVGGTYGTLGEDHPVDLVFEDVRVPTSAMIGERGRALPYMLSGIGRARLNIGALAIGKAEYLLSRMTDYAGEREAFGRPISKFQYVQQFIVDSSIEIEAGLGLMDRAAECAESDDHTARRLTASVKLYATEMLSRVADRAIQLHGGMGVTHEGGVERYYRDARAMRVYEGSTELLKWNIARWLGLKTD